MLRRFRILAITGEGVQYESVTSKKFQKYMLPYSRLEVIIARFDEINPKSITKSVNALLNEADLDPDYVTEAYSYGIARAFRERAGKNMFLSQGELGIKPSFREGVE